MVTAVSAVVTAVIALGLGIWDRTETRKANALSVKPIISVGSPIETIDGVKRRSLTITNNGLGPADIKEIEFTSLNTGKKISVKDLESIFSEFELDHKYFVRSSWSSESVLLRQEESSVLFFFNYPKSAAQAYNVEMNYIRVLCQLSLRIKYYSLYDEPYELVLDRLHREGC